MSRYDRRGTRCALVWYPRTEVDRLSMYERPERADTRAYTRHLCPCAFEPPRPRPGRRCETQRAARQLPQTSKPKKQRLARETTASAGGRPATTQ
eukprot:294030-Prymnesium_polylepis.1